MGNIKKKFENETKTRIGIINFANSEKSSLQKLLLKDEIFKETSFMKNNINTIFPTEILCSSSRNNSIRMYLSIKKEDDIFNELKENILKSVHEAYLIFVNENFSEDIKNNKEKEEITFKKIFNNIIQQFEELYLNRFYEVDNIENVFRTIKFDELLNELKKINSTNNQEILEDKDKFIWENYLTTFQVELKKQYYKWIKMISRYYTENDHGHEYVNEEQEFVQRYSNRDFDNLCKLLYGIKSSCALMIERAYIEVPSSKEQFSGNVFINYIKDAKNQNIYKTIKSRIGQDYKELFIIVAKSYEEMDYFSKYKENINKATLDKRIFCILNDFNFYEDKFLKDKNNINIQENLVDILKFNVSKKIGISQDRVIVTEKFNDIDKNTLRSLNTNNDFLKLLRLMKVESKKVGRVIKIKPSSKENIISISLNQERMSVQALMGMLYERYNGYLVELWNEIIETEKSNKNNKKYYYSTIHTIIRNRKDDYKEYKHIDCIEAPIHKRTIDFSLRSGDYNDSKKILKMLVDYGYNTVGFDPNENKILVNVKGEISQEYKNNLIKSIKGRLEESAIDYFESAFLMDVSRKKFDSNSLYKALESEKKITIDDFYSAFKEIFKKMSKNILRYEVSLE